MAHHPVDRGLDEVGPSRGHVHLAVEMEAQQHLRDVRRRPQGIGGVARVEGRALVDAFEGVEEGRRVQAVVGPAGGGIGLTHVCSRVSKGRFCLKRCSGTGASTRSRACRQRGDEPSAQRMAAIEAWPTYDGARARLQAQDVTDARRDGGHGGAGKHLVGDLDGRVEGWVAQEVDRLAHARGRRDRGMLGDPARELGGRLGQGLGVQQSPDAGLLAHEPVGLVAG